MEPIAENSFGDYQFVVLQEILVIGDEHANPSKNNSVRRTFCKRKLSKYRAEIIRYNLDRLAEMPALKGNQKILIEELKNIKSNSIF